MQDMVWPLGICHPHYLCPENAYAGLAQLQNTPSGQAAETCTLSNTKLKGQQ